MASVIQTVADRVICPCLQVRESEIRGAIEYGGAESVKCVMKHTGAGTGCTSCHLTIRRMLAAQCEPSGSSPT